MNFLNFKMWYLIKTIWFLTSQKKPTSFYSKVIKLSWASTNVFPPKSHFVGALSLSHAVALDLTYQIFKQFHLYVLIIIEKIPQIKYHIKKIYTIVIACWWKVGTFPANLLWNCSVFTSKQCQLLTSFSMAVLNLQICCC